MRRHRPQNFALGQRLGDEAKLVVLEVTEAAMDEFGRGGRRAAGEIASFRKQNLQATPGRVACDAATVDAAPDDDQIVCRLTQMSAPSRTSRPNSAADAVSQLAKLPARLRATATPKMGSSEICHRLTVRCETWVMAALPGAKLLG